MPSWLSDMFMCWPPCFSVKMRCTKRYLVAFVCVQSLRRMVSVTRHSYMKGIDLESSWKIWPSSKKRSTDYCQSSCPKLYQIANVQLCPKHSLGYSCLFTWSGNLVVCCKLPETIYCNHGLSHLVAEYVNRQKLLSISLGSYIDFLLLYFLTLSI